MSVEYLHSVYLGIWRREYLMNSAGEFETKKIIFRAQTHRLYIELELICDDLMWSEAASLPITKYADLLFLEKNGVAGTINVDGNLCYWRRIIASTPLNFGVDCGSIYFEKDNGAMVDRVPGRYYERWRRIPNSYELSQEFYLVEFESGQIRSLRFALLLICGQYFVFSSGPSSGGRGRKNETSLASTMDGQNSSSEIFGSDCEFCFGEKGSGSDAWLISISTEDFCPGQRLFDYPSDFFDNVNNIKFGKILRTVNSKSRWLFSDIERLTQ